MLNQSKLKQTHDKIKKQTICTEEIVEVFVDVFSAVGDQSYREDNTIQKNSQFNLTLNSLKIPVYRLICKAKQGYLNPLSTLLGNHVL